MARPDNSTKVLAIPVSRETSRRLTQEARCQRRPRSAVARDILAGGLGDAPPDPFDEARRQSLLVRRRDSEREAVRFIADFADLESRG